MEDYQIKIIQSIVVLVSYIVIKIIVRKSLESIALKFIDQKARVKIIRKLLNTLLFILALGLILLVWGVEQSELIYFISTLLTILGIAFFAQWSIISNITSALIIFFIHAAKIGDTISVLDKDFAVEGRISDIGLFFIVIKTDEGEKVTLANNVFMQKMVKLKNSN